MSELELARHNKLLTNEIARLKYGIECAWLAIVAGKSLQQAEQILSSLRAGHDGRTQPSEGAQ